MPPPVDPFDLEFDRFNGGLAADTLFAEPPKREPLEPLGRPVDIDMELDM